MSHVSTNKIFTNKLILDTWIYVITEVKHSPREVSSVRIDNIIYGRFEVQIPTTIKKKVKHKTTLTATKKKKVKHKTTLTYQKKWGSQATIE